MPVVLRPEQYDEWIDPVLTDADAVARMIGEARTDFAHHPVSTRVNSLRNESPDLTERM